MIYLFSLIFSLIFTFIFWKLGKKWKVLDQATEDPLKIHKESIPCLGGLAMFLALSLSFALKMIIEKSLDCWIFSVIAAGCLIFLLGLADDLQWRDKKKIKPVYKLIFLVLFSFLSALVLSTANLGINLILVLIVIFVLINAVNYQDGMDGLAAGTTIISLVGFSVLGYFSGNILIFNFCLILLFVILGFLVFNFPPAKIFMGDSGSYWLGFNLAFLTVFFLRPYNILNILALAFVLGLPLFDGVFTNIRRIIKGGSILKGDREHFYDRLLNKRLSSRKTLFICLVIQVILVSLALLIL
jgi:UDP-GlcNAc:undecaprenyl-phosphate GlcNAc-1-phosphate transferase